MTDAEIAEWQYAHCDDLDAELDTPQINARSSFSLGPTPVWADEGRDAAPSRSIWPYARRCCAPGDAVLMPGESLYASVRVSPDVHGFAVDESGEYAADEMLDHGR